MSLLRWWCGGAGSGGGRRATDDAMCPMRESLLSALEGYRLPRDEASSAAMLNRRGRQFVPR